MVVTWPHPYQKTPKKRLSPSILHIAKLIRKQLVVNHEFNGLFSIAGIGSIMWRLAQVISESGWDRYKVSQNHSSPSPEVMGAYRVFPTDGNRQTQGQESRGERICLLR